MGHDTAGWTARRVGMQTIAFNSIAPGRRVHHAFKSGRLVVNQRVIVLGKLSSCPRGLDGGSSVQLGRLYHSGFFLMIDQCQR